VGDVVAYDAERGLAVATKNAFSVGDRLELIHPAGNSEVQVERLITPAGDEISRVPGSDHRVWLPFRPKASALLWRVLSE
jgi:putative protease